MLRAAETIQRTDTGLQRRGNEDSSYARAPLFVVADGMGGAQAGEVASQIAITAFEQGLPEAGSPEERLVTRVREANAEIYERSQAEHERAGMGTTLTAAYLDEAHLVIAHVGDSRAYLIRDGKLKQLTQDHSLVGELVRRGKLTEEQAAEHPQRSIITRALGPEPSVEVDTWTYPARAGDVLLLCSDGLTSMISEERIGQILASATGLDQAAEALIAGANEAGGRDNITVVLVRLEDVGGDGALEQPTVAGMPAVRPEPGASAVPPAAAPSLKRPGGPVAVAEPLSRSDRPRLARTQGKPPAGGPPSRRDSRWTKPVSALLATLIVLFLIGGGGYIATRQLYFIGTNAQGIITVYRGLPYDLPAGIRLYETFYTSGVPAAFVPANRRASLLNHHLRSQSDATKLILALERGQISK
ncbi:MAG: Stp1/IreP family PP2C-type Ser/Thr phosphatase [Actinomycetota bacterium]|nr:Stp1/IreP family PP2C-type Ser/Thr phosphatase [Actinomycetota bacterium]